MAGCHKKMTLQIPEAVYSGKEDGWVVSPEIDEGIAELVTILWNMGIVPTACCENTSSDIQVKFATYEKKDNLVWLQLRSEHYRKFMSLLSKFDEPQDGDLYDRIMRHDGFYSRFGMVDEKCYIRDFFEDFEGKKFDSPDIDISCDVYFDRSLLEEVVTKLTK